MIEAFARSAALDAYLGDRRRSDSVIRVEDSLAWDEASAFPEEVVEALNAWGLQRSYVPATLGGEFVDVLPSMLQIRQVARRDITAAVAHGKTFLGSLCSWLVGGEASERMASIVLSGSLVSWGLTEQGRGSDILRSSTRGSISDGFRLDGRKWPINNATRGRAMSVLVRTRDEVGPRSLSLVLADKDEIDGSRVSHLPKVRTHGVKGADISGIEWDDVPIPNDRMIGEQGQGLELVLRALQLTRTTCTALSLGGVDQAVESVMNFLSVRRLYGHSLGELPRARADAGAIVADALVAEATAIVGARHVVELTEEMALVSALVKYVVPSTVDALFRNATRFLGARSQLTGIAGAGTFEKASRDNRVVGIFDGNTVVNLQVIVNEFTAIAKGSECQVDLDWLFAALDPGVPTSGLDLKRLRLVTRMGSSLLAAIPQLAASVAEGASGSLTRVLTDFAAATLALLVEVRASERATLPGPAHFELARKLAEAFAGASCLVVATRNSVPTDLARAEQWLPAALGRVCIRMGVPVAGSTAACAALHDITVERHKEGDVVTLFEGWLA